MKQQTPRINRFLGEWLSNLTKEGLALDANTIHAKAYNLVGDDVVPGLVLWGNSPLHQQLEEVFKHKAFTYVSPIEIGPIDLELDKYYRFEVVEGVSIHFENGVAIVEESETTFNSTFYGTGKDFIARAIFEGAFALEEVGHVYEDKDQFYEDIMFETLFHNRPVFLLGEDAEKDVKVTWEDMGLAMVSKS